MTAYVIRRLLMVPVLLMGVTILIFGLVSFMGPTERISMYVTEIPKNERQLDGMIKKLGLDRPIYEQYWVWLVGKRNQTTGEISGGLLRGEFGYSRTSSQPVIDIIKSRFPATLELALYALLPVLGAGVLLGVIAAVNHNNPIDQITRVISIVGWSFPTFVFGLLVLMYFYADLQWFPPGRLSVWANQIVLSDEFTSYTSLISVDALINGRFDIFVDAIRHLVLPVVTLAYLSWALMLRVARSSMLETLGQDYITSARAKGLSEMDVVRKHALPNALIPVVTIAGFTVIGLLNGVVITETIFNYPGIGRTIARAAVALDVPTVLVLTLFTGFILVVVNVFVDILYAVIDPRVRYT